MLAEDKINSAETEHANGEEGRVDGNRSGKGTTSWRIKGIEVEVRDEAKEAAKTQGIKLSDFVAEAIRQHIERLENEIEAADGQAGGALSYSLETCIARIEALENRLARLETPDTHRTKLMAHKRVRNLVERPWLKNRNYL